MLEIIDPIKMMNDTWRSVSSPPSRTTLQQYEYSYILISEEGHTRQITEWTPCYKLQRWSEMIYRNYRIRALPVLNDGRFIQDLVHATANIPTPIQRRAKVSASQSRPSYSSSDQYVDMQLREINPAKSTPSKQYLSASNIPPTVLAGLK